MVEWLRDIWARSVAVATRTARDRDFDEELAAHIALAVDEAVARGARPDDARRLVLAKFGGLDAAREIHRDARGWPSVESLAQDVRRAFRRLRRTPVVTAAALASLALGMGGTTTMFSLLNGLVLEPLPVRAPNELAVLIAGDDYANWKLPVWEQLRGRTDLFSGIVAWSHNTTLDLAERGESRPVAAYLVSGGFFDVLGVEPHLGRLLSASDDVGVGKEGAVAVLSDGFWRTQFGGAPDVVGKPLHLNGATFRVVGVAPRSFFGPEVGRSFDVIVPIASAELLGPANSRIYLLNLWLSVMARLKPHQNAAAATAALRAAMPEVLRGAADSLQAAAPGMAAIFMPPESRAMFEAARVEPAPAGPSALRDQYERAIATVAAISLLVLLIACLNVANLLLARSDARRHEFAVAIALGATRARLVRQLAIESLVLSTIGAICGAAIAAWTAPVLVRQLSSAHQAIVLSLPFDWRLLSLAGAASVATAMLFGTAPAFRAAAVPPHSALSTSTRMIHGRTGGRGGGTLVAVQVALSLVLTISSALLVGTFVRLEHHELGFDPDAVLILDVTPRPTAATHDGDTARRRRILDAVQAAPGVASAAFSNVTPLSVGRMMGAFTSPDSGASASERQVFEAMVSPGWLRTMGIPLRRGREYSWGDEQPGNVIVVNDALARMFFGSRDPVGLTLRGHTGKSYTVIGMTADAVYQSAREGAPPTAYLLSTSGYGGLYVRPVTGRAGVLTRSVVETIVRTDPDVLVSSTMLSESARASVARERVTAILAGFFGALALLLAAVGIYGVMAYAVNRRRTEMAVRRALGATTADVVREVVGRGLTAAGAGVVAGMTLSLWTSDLLTPLLYGVGPRDIRTFAGAAAALVVVAIGAAWLPARRAATVDPAILLREG